MESKGSHMFVWHQWRNPLPAASFTESLTIKVTFLAQKKPLKSKAINPTSTGWSIKHYKEVMCFIFHLNSLLGSSSSFSLPLNSPPTSWPLCCHVSCLSVMVTPFMSQGSGLLLILSRISSKLSVCSCVCVCVCVSLTFGLLFLILSLTMPEHTHIHS